MTSPTVPTILSVAQFSGALQVFWNTVSDKSITSYVVTVFYSSVQTGVDAVLTSATVAASGSQTQGTMVQLPGGGLNPGTAYFVQVSTMWGGSPGQNQQSQLVPLITTLPVLTAGYYDGSNFHMQWQPMVQASQGYCLQLQPAAGTPVTALTYSPTDSWGTIPNPPLAGAPSWSVLLSAAGTIGSNSGTNQYAAGYPIALPSSLATPQGLTATLRANGDGWAIDAQWNTLAASGTLTGYRLQVFAPDGTPGIWTAIANLSISRGTLFLDQPLAPGSSLRLLAVDGNGVGVSTAAQPIVTTLPVVTGAVMSTDGKSITVTWQSTPDVNTTGYVIQVYDPANSSSLYSQTVTGATTQIGVVVAQSGLDGGKAWRVRVLAVGSAGTVSGQGESLSLAVAQPVVQSALVNDDELAVTWTLPAGAHPPAAYEVSVVGTIGAPVSVVVAGGKSTEAHIPRYALLGTGLSQTVTVTGQNGDAVTGQPSQSCAVWITPIMGLGASADPITGLTTISWTYGDGSNYALWFSNGQQASSSTTSYMWPTPLAAGAKLAVKVCCQVSGIPLRSSPFSIPYDIPTAQTTPRDVRFSASTMTVSLSWDPLDGATGYRLVLVAVKGGTTTLVATTDVASPATSGTVPFPKSFSLAAGVDYQVRIQGLWSGNSAPPGASQSIFKSGFYLSTTAASALPPFVYPATQLTTATASDAANPGEPIVLYLPDIGGGQALSGLPLVVAPFTLAANVGANAAIYPFTLTIANSGTANPWTFSAGQTIRTDLAAAYQSFLLKLDTATGVTSQGITMIQQAVGRLMPQTFAEQLYYNYGLTLGSTAPQGYVDLRPGMVLRVVSNPWQTVAGQVTSSWVNGYGLGAVTDYDVGSFFNNTGNWSVGFDSFIGQLVASGAIIVNPPNVGGGIEEGIAEAADLYFSQPPFYRLFIPNTLLPPTPRTNPQSNYAQTNLNFVLAAAPDYQSLTTSSSTPGGGSVTVAYFRGRAVVKACLRVSVNGQPQVVPVGTTLGNLLESNGRTVQGVPTPIRGLRLTRGLGGAVLDPSQTSPASYGVRLDWDAAGAKAYGPGWGATAMPLLPGDSIILE